MAKVKSNYEKMAEGTYGQDIINRNDKPKHTSAKEKSRRRESYIGKLIKQWHQETDHIVKPLQRQVDAVNRTRYTQTPTKIGNKLHAYTEAREIFINSHVNKDEKGKTHPVSVAEAIKRGRQNRGLA